MIDIEKAREVLKKYIQEYDNKNPKVILKREHILRVADNAKLIASNLNLSQEDINLAELIGLLHDIGRFEQLRIYNTFNDNKSIDHGLKGTGVLFEQNLIRKFLKEKDYDKIIYLAIKNHNKKIIEEGLNDRELLHAKIIRDADKLDIFNIISNAKLADAVWFPTENIENEKISDDIFKQMIEDRLVSYADIKTNIDCMITWIAYVYDINFKISLEIINNKDYLNKLIDRVNYKDKITKDRINYLKEQANEYIKQKLK